MTLVSAVMPTRGRAAWAAQALQCFLSQTYPRKELIILDDADAPSFKDETVSWFNDVQSCYWGQVRYSRNRTKQSIPNKRNQVCEMARGDIIWHLDSDDWSAPERMAQQVKLLEDSGKAVTGYHSCLFLDVDSGRVARYVTMRKNYAVGATLCFKKSWWHNHRFPVAHKLGSDDRFVNEVMKYEQIVTAPGDRLFVARQHGDRSQKERDITRDPFRAASSADLPEAFRRQQST